MSANLQSRPPIHNPRRGLARPAATGFHHRIGEVNAITGVDISTHLIREAATLARSESLEGIIEFRERSAEALPFPDNSFDMSMSFTMIHFVDADQMLGEMMRVTRPEGRVAVLTHGY